MITILGILVTVLSGSITTITLSYCLTPKYPRKHSIPLFVFLLTIVISLRNTCGTLLLPLFVLISQFLLLGYLLLCHSNNLLTIFLSYIAIICIVIYPAEYITTVIITAINGEFSLDHTTYSYLITSVLCCLLGLLLHLIYYIIWQWLARHITTSLQLTITTSLLMHTLVLFVLFNYLYNKGLNSNILLASIILILTAIIISVVLFIFAAKQNEKDAAEAAYEELKHLHELEKENYLALETRTEELSRIRHDINNHFVTINVLLNSGKIKEAEQFTKELLDHLSDD